jgi:hypothetical protein
MYVYKYVVYIYTYIHTYIFLHMCICLYTYISMLYTCLYTNRKWGPLRDTLADLKTFDMMYTSDDLRDELVSYWMQLTQGPLFILSETQLQVNAYRE